MASVNKNLDFALVSWYLGNPFWMKARSSGGERYLDTVEVGGSRPPAPTIQNKRAAGASEEASKFDASFC